MIVAVVSLLCVRSQLLLDACMIVWRLVQNTRFVC